MNIEHVIRNFASAGDRLPRASMQWALDNWDIAGPAFVEWAGWCMTPDFLFGDATLTEKSNFMRFRAPIRFAHTAIATSLSGKTVEK